MPNWQYINQANKFRPAAFHSTTAGLLCDDLRASSINRNTDQARFRANPIGVQAEPIVYAPSQTEKGDCGSSSIILTPMDIVQCIQLVLINMSIMVDGAVARGTVVVLYLDSRVNWTLVCDAGWKVNMQQDQQWLM